MLGIVAVLVLVLGGALGGYFWYLSTAEERDREAAVKLYADGQFDKASELYRKLVEQHPDSPGQDDYRFMQELSAVRAWRSTPTPRGPSIGSATFSRSARTTRCSPSTARKSAGRWSRSSAKRPGPGGEPGECGGRGALPARPAGPRRAAGAGWRLGAEGGGGQSR